MEGLCIFFNYVNCDFGKIGERLKKWYLVVKLLIVYGFCFFKIELNLLLFGFFFNFFNDCVNKFGKICLNLNVFVKLMK